jgi:hypothetical protein
MRWSRQCDDGVAHVIEQVSRQVKRRPGLPSPPSGRLCL